MIWSVLVFGASIVVSVAAMVSTNTFPGALQVLEESGEGQVGLCF